MIAYPDIDPIVFALGPLKIRWYGLMYVLGFALAWLLLRYRARSGRYGWEQAQVEDLIFYGAMGLLFGGRIGYVLFYGMDNWLADPLYLVRITEGGMSFHGGLLGAIVAIFVYGRRNGRGFFEVADFLAPGIPLGLGAGRIGNFINGELWGKVTDVPWAFIVNGEPRHPSQLYEALLEGPVLFAILWVFSSRERPAMTVSGLFLLGYGVFRFGVEFVRVPDQHLGYLAFGWFTMGQLLTLPMIVFGALLIGRGYAGRRGAIEARG